MQDTANDVMCTSKIDYAFVSDLVVNSPCLTKVITLENIFSVRRVFYVLLFYLLTVFWFQYAYKLVNVNLLITFLNIIFSIIEVVPKFYQFNCVIFHKSDQINY